MLVILSFKGDSMLYHNNFYWRAIKGYVRSGDLEEKEKKYLAIYSQDPEQPKEYKKYEPRILLIVCENINSIYIPRSEMQCMPTTHVPAETLDFTEDLPIEKRLKNIMPAEFTNPYWPFF